MTRTKKALAVAAIAVGALGGATVPAMADNHSPIAQDSIAALDNHLPAAPQDSHAPLIPQGMHSALSPMDSHTP
ncbi:hypothetical protein [Streptomyces sp. YGL11-2]|uniref:hypothetical protein n=1 Tax=Streptomyces sp. YGL11-2 TaxID=3414028 RepID=UPI003CF3E20D